MKYIIIFLFLVSSANAQLARPTYNPFNNGMMMPNQGFQFPNNTNHPLNFHRPNNFGFQNNFQRPQQFLPQNQPQYFPQQNNWQQPQHQQPQVQPQVQPQQTTPLPTPLFTRRFHLNNGYLFGRPTWYDPKSNKMQPWIRKNLR